jgi:hypothetical protein
LFSGAGEGQRVTDNAGYGILSSLKEKWVREWEPRLWTGGRFGKSRGNGNADAEFVKNV